VQLITPLLVHEQAMRFESYYHKTLLPWLIILLSTRYDVFFQTIIPCECFSTNMAGKLWWLVEPFVLL
jgi:hypothetical protein